MALFIIVIFGFQPQSSKDATVRPLKRQYENIVVTSGSESSTPKKKKLKRQVKFCENKIKNQGLKIKRLQSKNRRLTKKINNLDEILTRLEEKFSMAKENLDCLRNTNLEVGFHFFFVILLILNRL